MTRKLVRLDRCVVLLVGLVLVGAGLAAVDWRLGYVVDVPGALSTTSVQDVLTTGWWPWAFAVAGVVLGLLGLWWAAAHLRREGPTTLRSHASDESGRVEIDVRSVAGAAAAHLAALAPVVGARGTTRTYGSTTLVELRGRVDPAADVDVLTWAAEACSAHVADAFPDDSVVCRVVLDAPQRTKPGRADRVRVR